MGDGRGPALPTGLRRRCPVAAIATPRSRHSPPLPCGHLSHRSAGVWRVLSCDFPVARAVPLVKAAFGLCVCVCVCVCVRKGRLRIGPGGGLTADPRARAWRAVVCASMGVGLPSSRPASAACLSAERVAWWGRPVGRNKQARKLHSGVHGSNSVHNCTQRPRPYFESCVQRTPRRSCRSDEEPAPLSGAPLPH
jgi:hypothetical protein